MEKLEGYNSRLKRLTELVAQLEGGELSLDGLSEMESITRELHERSIILRYNAFKDQVMPDEDNSEGIMDEDGGVEVEVIIEEIEEEEPEVEEEEKASDGESADDQTIDFSIFDDNDDEKPESTLEPIIEESIEIEPIIEEEPEPEPIEDLVEPEPVIEEIPEPEVEETPESVEEESASDMTPESFLDKLKIEDNSIATRFSASKLDSLIGAFGLNQRLRYINDLFDGSSEVFSDAIKALDTQSSLDDAKQKAAQLATDYEWDPEEEVVIEFMSFVSRRYA